MEYRIRNGNTFSFYAREQLNLFQLYFYEWIHREMSESVLYSNSIIIII